MDRATRTIGMCVMTVGFTFTCIVAAPGQAMPTLAQEENITVSCFKGNLDEGNNVGELTVSKAENAGRDCNNFYQECQGQCVGCLYDYESSRQVCYDANGTKIQK